MAARYYGLFFKAGRRWVRLYPRLAYLKDSAIVKFQTRLIDLFMRGRECELRPLPYRCPKCRKWLPAPAPECRGCELNRKAPDTYVQGGFYTGD